MLDLGSNKRRDYGDNSDYVNYDESAQRTSARGDFGTNEDEWQRELQSDSIWKGWQGICVMLFGVVLPSLLIVSGMVACYDRIVLLLLKQPIETLLELGLLLSIPLGNLTIWTSICKSDLRHSMRKGIINGIAIGSSAVVSLITGIAAILRFPTLSATGIPHIAEFAFMAFLSILATAVGVQLALKMLQTRIVRASRKRAIGYAVFGVALAFFAFVLAEARSTCVRVAEYIATSDTIEERRKGLALLKWLNPEKELRMECSSRKAGGLPGLFIRIDNDTLRQLHFALSGKTFGEEQSQNFSAMTNEYLKNHVVGDRVEGLSLQKSAVFGTINPTTVSSTVYWTFVFKNKNYEDKEARAEIGLPEGAAISGMTVWKDGRPLKTMFTPTGEQTNTKWRNIGHDAPGIITDLGRGRMLLHCYPVPAQGYLRMSVAVTIPLRLHTISDTSLALPRFVETNFDLKGDHALRLVSENEMSLAVSGVKAGNAANGQHLLSGTISPESLSGAGLAVRVKRPAVYGPVAMYDDSCSPPKYLVQTIRELPSVQPQQLVVVLDGSQSMKPHLKGLKKVLSNLPAGIDASLVVASNRTDEKPSAVPIKEALKNIKEDSFEGGQDNLESIITATGIAGESKRGAVLWIHGPQPGFNNEIYLMPPYMFTPSFYEMALDEGAMDSAEYFKNHREIGPFNEISRSASPESDLERFLSKWNPGGHDYVVEYQLLDRQPKEKLVPEEVSRATAALFAREKVSQLLRAGDTKKATDMAVYHRIVTPVSLASCTGEVESLESERLAREHGTRNVRIVDSSAGGYVKPAAADRQAAVNSTTSDTTSAASPYSGQGHYADASGTAAVSGNTGDFTPFNPSISDAFSANGSTKSVLLQGATNGTIGPQGCDATSIMGVNTAGTVRVNNLANLENALNIFANMVEVLCMGIGAVIMLSAAFGTHQSKDSVMFMGRMCQPQRMFLGAMLIILGLMTPGMINYMIASARDANLFS